VRIPLSRAGPLGRIRKSRQASVLASITAD
jgi:hypothetical protein